MLSQVARSLEEPIELHATHKRLSANLDNEKLEGALSEAVSAYLTRWRVEDTICFIKQSYGLENVRVLTYRRLKNLVTLLLAVAYFTAVRVGVGARMKILSLHMLDAAKRLFGIPNFRFYALADGMRSILLKAAKGTL